MNVEISFKDGLATVVVGGVDVSCIVEKVSLGLDGNKQPVQPEVFLKLVPRILNVSVNDVLMTTLQEESPNLFRCNVCKDTHWNLTDGRPRPCAHCPADDKPREGP